MSHIDYIWHTSTPPVPDVYETRRNDSRYQTLRYWDGHRWWQIEWHRARGSEPFTWPKRSRTRFPAGMARYRETLALRRINDPHQGVVQWGHPIRVFDEKEVLAHLVKTGRLRDDWRTAYQDEMRTDMKVGRP